MARLTFAAIPFPDGTVGGAGHRQGGVPDEWEEAELANGNAFGCIDGRGSLPQLQQVLQPHDEFFHAKRLAHIVVSARAETRQHVLGLRLGSQEEDGRQMLDQTYLNQHYYAELVIYPSKKWEKLNYLEQQRINTLQRYVMLTFAYSIQGFGKEGRITIDLRGVGEMK